MVTKEEIEKRALELACAVVNAMTPGKSPQGYREEAERELIQEAAEAVEDERLGRAAFASFYKAGPLVMWEELHGVTRRRWARAAKAVLEAAKSQQKEQPASASEVKLPFEIRDTYGDKFEVYWSAAGKKVYTEAKNGVCTFTPDQAVEVAAAIQEAARKVRGGQ